MKGKIIIPILVAVFGVTAICVMSGCYGKTLLDLTSLLIVPILPLLYMAGIYGFRGIGKAYQAAVKPHSEAAISEMRRARSFFRELGRTFWLFGIIGAFVGFIAILWNLENPEYLGKNLSVALITILYAALSNLILVQPFSSALGRDLAEYPEQ